MSHLDCLGIYVWVCIKEGVHLFVIDAGGDVADIDEYGVGYELYRFSEIAGLFH